MGATDMEPVDDDSTNPYAEISLAVDWFLFCFGYYLGSSLAQYGSPAGVLKRARELAHIEPDQLNPNNRERWEAVKRQVMLPLFEKYVKGIYGDM